MVLQYLFDRQDLNDINNIKHFNYLKLITCFVIYLFVMKSKNEMMISCFYLITISFLIILLFSILSNKLLLFDKKINKLVRNYIFSISLKIMEAFIFITSSLFFFISEQNREVVLNFLIDFLIISLLNLVEVYKLHQLLRDIKIKIEILKNSNNSLHIENLKNIKIRKIIAKYENNFILNKKNMEKKNSEMICTICQEKIITPKCSLTSCKHPFHSMCLYKWLKESESCPLCRTNILNDHTNNTELQII